MKLKSLLIRNFNYTLENQNFSTSVLEKSENVYLFVSVSLLIPFGVCIYMQYFFKYLPELIKRRSKIREKNMSS